MKRITFIFSLLLAAIASGVVWWAIQPSGYGGKYEIVALEDAQPSQLSPLKESFNQAEFEAALIRAFEEEAKKRQR